MLGLRASLAHTEGVVLCCVCVGTQGVSVDSLKVAFAQYDGPLKVLGRHNEIWAWEEEAPSAAAKSKKCSQAKAAAGESSARGVCVCAGSHQRWESNRKRPFFQAHQNNG